MKKDELVSAIAKAARRAQRQNGNGKALPPFATSQSKNGSSKATSSKSNGNDARRSPSVRLRKPAAIPRKKDLSAGKNGKAADSLTAEPTELNWLRASWHLSSQAIDRAAAALGTEWHQAQPTIRVQRLDDDDDGSGMETIEADVIISGDTDVWFIRIDDPQATYRLQIGYSTPGGRFFAIARSLPVSPVTEFRSDQVVEDRRSFIFRRPEDSGILQRGPATEINPAAVFDLNLETELVVKGQTHPNSNVTLLGESVQVSADGTFQVNCLLDNGREVYPAVAVSPDGAEQRTVILAIEQNTKSLEPYVFDEN